jgi:coenzyme F420-reducing hydrogenase gamma subunit
MSILDLDERLIELTQFADLVYSPLVDTKEYPENVDIVLVEGAVSTDEDLHKNSHHSAAHQNSRLARRLRGDLQRSGDAQPVLR